LSCCTSRQHLCFGKLFEDCFCFGENGNNQKNESKENEEKNLMNLASVCQCLCTLMEPGELHSKRKRAEE
jgi:hypothetical protein